MSEGVNASLISALEVARRLRKSRSTVLRLVEKGELPYEIKLPGTTGSYLFSSSVVEMYRRNQGDAA